MQKEVIYLYGGENQPKVKLTCIAKAKDLQQLTAYFHELQNLYHLKFRCEETITENLKVECISHGAKEMDSWPFYIIDYDEVYDSFYIWKTNGKWELNKMVSAIYRVHSGSKQVNSTWRKYFLRDSRYKKHPMKNWLTLALNQLNVDWSHVNLDDFWIQFNVLFDLHQNDETVFNEFSFKSFISMSLLRAAIAENKRYVEEKLSQYYNSMKKNVGTANYNTMLENERKSHSGAEGNDSTVGSNETSPEFSLFPAEFSDGGSDDLNADAVDLNVETSGLYTYKRDRQDGKRNSISVPATNDQIFANFKSHFQNVVEDYEVFELRSKKGVPIQSRARRNSHKRVLQKNSKNSVSKA
ncbi:chromatin-associated RNAPIII regulator FPT1 KNAG_0C01620 [Huiozyma naganishii CBS 8797]|uniref:Uncharacterized protein n=1 Tax=Huiozyma naganishii (strain ATCC MYA-139 / BCRC 22969 / CBS 8797 / KCTC 17520 / NBRC 10181 / NCYC 3082 / Yp74L-3) TaxID=1071383 RepID=J7R365_HUIN7|nr:hypothetical protein KNAG_0C01620 [Kazachstania naganishii CBS 8797]CCK69275.1 hypothetical protein KNAG_0C01620 [Kazachstania naganishii CBS 8797]